MTKYICMLRGINVSGQKKVPMQELKELFTEAGFTDAVTYIQSGNVVFSSKLKSQEKIAAMIERFILDHFAFDVPAIIRNEKEMQRILSDNPFLKRKGVDEERLYITFLETSPEPGKVKLMNEISFPGEEFIHTDREIYIYCPGGYGNTKLSNNFFENKLKVRATTRNLKTSRKLEEMVTLTGK